MNGKIIVGKIMVGGIMILPTMILPTTYRHVPTWLARRYPAIAALEDNPLYLRLTGQAYCRRGWFARRRQRWFPREHTALLALRCAMVAAMLVFIVPRLYDYAVLWVPLAGAVLALLCAHKYGFSDVTWGAESRAGRMLDIHLAMSSEEIVDALVGARMIPGWRTILVVAVALVATGVTLAIRTAMAHTEVVIGQSAILGGASLLIGITLPLAAYCDISLCYRAVAISLKVALDPSITRGWGRAVVNPVIVLVVVLLVAIVSERLVYGLAHFVPLTRVELCVAAPAIMVPIALLCRSLYKAAKSDIVAYRAAAVRSLKNHLISVIEANPPASGM